MSEHQPTGPARVVVGPDAEHPTGPIVVWIECSCDDENCFWSATAYDVVRA